MCGRPGCGSSGATAPIPGLDDGDRERDWPQGGVGHAPVHRCAVEHAVVATAAAQHELADRAEGVHGRLDAHLCGDGGDVDALAHVAATGVLKAWAGPITGPTAGFVGDQGAVGRPDGADLLCGGSRRCGGEGSGTSRERPRGPTGVATPRHRRREVVPVGVLAGSVHADVEELATVSMVYTGSSGWTCLRVLVMALTVRKGEGSAVARCVLRHIARSLCQRCAKADPRRGPAFGNALCQWGIRGFLAAHR